MMPHRLLHPRGFTLIELVLVLMLMSLLLLAAAPSLTGWNRARRLDAASDGLLSAARWARAEAIVTAVPHRLEVDTGAGSYRVTRRDTDVFGPVTGEFGRDTILPPGVTVELSTPEGVSLTALEFYPNGRGTPARIYLVSEAGGEVILRSGGAADPLRRVEP